jgi:filamentous hemagglutinin
VAEVGLTTEKRTVYNLHVEKYHTYFVGEAGWEHSVWVHNANAQGNCPPDQREDAPNAGNVAEGSFSITEQGWRGYPEGIPRPQGPFRVLEGAEYDAARKAANQANQAIRKADPGSLVGKEIHEIQPVKFGGSPTDPANKIPLPADIHRQQVTPWWNRFLRSLQGNGGGS